MLLKRRAKMKSAKKIVVAVAMMAAMVAVLCSCGGGNDGTYVVQNMMGMDVQQLLDLYSSMGGDDATVPKSAEDLATLKISGKSFTMKVSGQDDVTGDCEISGETIKLTAQGETMEGTIKDGVITVDEGGTSMTFKKK